jgi:hypothetical protein
MYTYIYIHIYIYIYVSVLAAVQTVTGVSLQQANTPAFIDSFKTITATSMGGHVTPAKIVVGAITAVSGRRVLLQSGVSVAYTVTVINTNATTLNTNLNAAISGGSFTAALVSSGYPAATSGTC